MSRYLGLICVLTAFGAGCSSMKSTLLERDSSDSTWETTKTDGLPITLKVPTHFRVAIVDVRHAHRPNDDIGWTLLEHNNKPLVVTQVDHDFIYTEKVFTVDPRRPAAGDIDFTFDVDSENQYIDQIQSDITDRTIEEASGAFERLLVALAPGVSSGSDREQNRGTATNPLSPIVSVRDVRIFEIDNPCFEQDVSAFLWEHFGMAATVPEAAFAPAAAPSEPVVLKRLPAPEF